MENFGDKKVQNDYLYKQKKTQSGRSMIEMLGVLAIVGILSAGGIAGYNMAMQSYKTNLLIEKTQIIATRARQVFKGAYSDITRNRLIDSGKLSADDFKHPFGGDINVGTSGWGNDKFHVQLGNLPAETCTDMLLTDWGESGVFEGIHIISDRDRSLRYSSGSWPVSTNNAVAYCKSGTTLFDIVFK